MPRRAFWPYIPTQPEWADVPWERAQTIAFSIYGTTNNLQFIGHDREAFWFQVRGLGEFPIVKQREAC